MVGRLTAKDRASGHSGALHWTAANSTRLLVVEIVVGWSCLRRDFLPSHPKRNKKCAEREENADRSDREMPSSIGELGSREAIPVWKELEQLAVNDWLSGLLRTNLSLRGLAWSSPAGPDGVRPILTASRSQRDRLPQSDPCPLLPLPRLSAQQPRPINSQHQEIFPRAIQIPTQLHVFSVLSVIFRCENAPMYWHNDGTDDQQKIPSSGACFIATDGTFHRTEKAKPGPGRSKGQAQ